MPESPLTARDISLIVPVHRGGDDFRRCLTALIACQPAAGEIIVIADGDEQSAQLATQLAAQLAESVNLTVLRTASAAGPACARNAGARIAKGALLFFVDADVLLPSDALAKVLVQFHTEPTLTALFGSYDDQPAASNFLSQYKNLFHHYVHQTSAPQATTFWSGCGVIRREIFLAVDGFNEQYRRPAIEDIELGYRLTRAGHSIRLDRDLQVKHLKRWDAGSLIETDFFARALPWTELILRGNRLVNDLNLRYTSRFSILSIYCLLLALLSSYWWRWPAIGLAAALVIALCLLNWPLYRFFFNKRGGWFTLQAIPWHWLYYSYCGLAFALALLRWLVRDLIRGEHGETAR